MQACQPAHQGIESFFLGMPETHFCINGPPSVKSPTPVPDLIGDPIKSIYFINFK